MKTIVKTVLLYATSVFIFASSEKCVIQKPVLELSNCISTLKNLTCKLKLPWLQNCTQDYTLVMFSKHTDEGYPDPSKSRMIKHGNQLEQSSKKVPNSGYWEWSWSKVTLENFVHHHSRLSLMLQILNSSGMEVEVSDIMTFNISQVEKGPSFSIQSNSTSDSLGINLHIDNKAYPFCATHAKGVKILVSLSSMQYPDLVQKVIFSRGTCNDTSFQINEDNGFQIYGGTTYEIRFNLLYNIEGHLGNLPQYLSEQNVTITTKQAEPAAVPHVTSSSYQILSRKETILQARLFWQPILKKHTNGELRCTRIRAFQVNLAKDVPNSELQKCGRCQPSEAEIVTIEGTHMIHKTVGPSESSATISLHEGNLYKVFIDSINSVGCAKDLFISNQVEPIRINAQENLSEISRVAVEADRNEVLVTWTPVNNAVNYTLYWCNSPSGSRCEKNSTIQWRSLPGSKTEYNLVNLTVSNINFHTFAVSATVEQQGFTVSVPMTFARCIYQSEQDLQAPEDLKLTPIKNNKLLVTWTNPVCSESRLIGSYQLLYCVLEDKDCTPAVQHIEIADGVQQQEIIGNILPGKNYQVWLNVAAHDRNITKETKPQTVEAPEPGRYSKHLFYILPAAIVALVVVVAIWVFWRYRKPCKVFLKGPLISLPPTNGQQAPSSVPSVSYYKSSSDNLEDQQNQVLLAKPQTEL